MASYDNVSHPAVVALDAVTPVKLFSSRTEHSVGYRVTNGTGVTMYILELLAGTSGPTFADMVTDGKHDFVVPTLAMQESGARETIDVWACLASGTGNVYAKEIF